MLPLFGSNRFGNTQIMEAATALKKPLSNDIINKKADKEKMYGGIVAQAYL